MFMSFLTMILLPSNELLIKGNFRIQRTMASINNGVKVIFVPSLFSNSFFTLSLHITRLVTSASVNEVTWGLVCLLLTIWSAINRRMRSISMISTLPLYVVGAEDSTLFTGIIICC